MKKHFGIFFFFLIIGSLCLNAQSQNIKRAQVGITFSSFGRIEPFRPEGLLGGSGHIGKKFFSLGIDYLYPLNNWLAAESGLEFTKLKILVTPPPMPNAGPGHDSYTYLLNVPISLRVDFLKYFFINGGFLFDIDISGESELENQTGLGTILGAGLNFNLRNGVSAFINPYFKVHSLLPLSFEKNHERIFESGFRFGILYQL